MKVNQKINNSLSLKRKVEMYQWEETKHKLEKKRIESMEKEKADLESYFIPKTLKKNSELAQKYPDDFLKRVEYYKLYNKQY